MRTIRYLIAGCAILGVLCLASCGKAQALDTPSRAYAETAQRTEQGTAALEGAASASQSSGADASASVTADAWTTDSVKVRTGPGQEYEAVTVLEPGTRVGVIEKENGDWTKVSYGGKVRYIASQYLSAGKAAGDTAAQTQAAAETENAGSTEGKTEADGKTSESSSSGGTPVRLDPSWRFADFSEINSGSAVLYKAKENRKNIVVGVNAGHGTEGGGNVKTFCHPDKTQKVTGGTTGAGATKAVAVSAGMSFSDGTPERKITLKTAQLLKSMLLDAGYDVLMLRDGEDVQLDNVARTVLCNNLADCHIALHFDGDGLDYDKGCFYMSVPDGIKYLDPVASTWEKDEKLGDCLVGGLKEAGCRIFGGGSMDMDLTQTSFSSVPSVDIELGNQCSAHDAETLEKTARGLLAGVNRFFGKAG